MADSPESASSSGLIQTVSRALVPDFVRRRFTLKFALILIVMGLVIGALGVVATQSVSGQVEENVEQEYQELAKQQAGVVETWIQRNAIAVKVSAENEILTQTGSGAAIDMTRYLSRTSASLYDMQSIYVLEQTEDSTSVVASPQLPDGQSLADGERAWIATQDLSDLKVGRARVTDVHEVDGTQLTAFISPVPDTSNRYLVVEYTTDSLTGALAPSEESERFTRVINADGTVQIATDGRRVFDSYSDGTANQYIERARTGVGVNANAQPDPSVLDQPYVVSHSPVEVDRAAVDWAVLVHEPQSSAFGFVRTITKWGTIVTFGAVLFIGLLGAVIGYTTSRDLNRLRGKVEEMEQGNLDVDIHSGRIDSIGRLYDGFASMRDALRQQINEAEQARKEAEVARAEAMEMNEYLQSKAREYSEIMEECAAGDLTRRMETDGENEAMDEIATDFNGMIEELENTTGQLKHFADEVEEAGEVVEVSAANVRDAAEQVADSIQHISDDAHEQQEQLEELASTIDEIIDQLETVDDPDVEMPLDQLREVTEMIEALAGFIDETMAESENVAGAAEEQAAELTEVSQQAQNLTRYAKPLMDVLDSFDTESKHEFYYPTGPGSPPSDLE
ncbi:PDC sensor domain-containing protein [Halorhabdus rudnickae]|uniref:PDC sensor domain-containing protein n=1 Tax=Halorhabdus rudnickae TaxID=1775544 RepID=UPI0014384C12|nr:HAMP domain-containing protein [Halorhabdus rudnickae]